MFRSALWPWLLVGLVVIGTAVFVRFDGLAEPSLWYDEVLHLEKAQASLDEPLSHWFGGLSVDRENGPLFYASQLAAMRVSTGEFAVRLVPALLGAITVLVMGGLGVAATGGVTTAIVAAILIATSPLHVYFSREGRPYAAVMLMASLLLLLLLVRNRRWTAPAVYGVSIITAYLGAVAAPVLLAFAVISSIEWLTCRRRGKWWQQHNLLAALLGISVVLLIFPAADRLTQSRIPPDYVVTHPLSKVALDRLLASMTVSGVDWATSRPSSFLLLALAGWGAIALAKRDKCRAIAIVGMFVLPIASWLALLVILDRWYLVRYTSAGLPAFLLLVAVGLVSSIETGWQRLAGDSNQSRTTWVPSLIAISLTVLLSISNWHAVRTESWQKPDWRSLAEMIGELMVDSEPVVAHNRWSATCIRYYLERAGSEIEVFNARNDLAQAKRYAQGRERAWVLSAGYRRATEFREWMGGLDLVFRGQLANLVLHYYPDFPAFLEPPERTGALARILEQASKSGRLQEFGDAELLLGAGWSYPETSQDGTGFRWSNAETAEIGFLTSTPLDTTLRLRLFPFPAANRPRQTIEAHLDGRTLGRLQLEPGWHEYELRLPEEWRQSEAHLVTLNFGWLQSPADLDPSAPDKRSLAVAFDRAETTGTDLDPYPE